MPTGLSIPVQLSPSGGFAMREWSEHDDDIIRSALGSDDNENAFQQDLAFGEDSVFDINDPQMRQKVLSKLRTLFDRFTAQKRYKLLEDTISWDDSGDNEQVLFFRYVNLETDKLQDYSHSFSAQSTT